MNENLQLRRLEALLAEHGLGPVELAHLAGLSYDFLCQIRTGNAPQITAEQVQRLANALGTTADYLLELSDEKTVSSVNATTRRVEDELAVWLRLDGAAEPVRASILPEITVTLQASSDDDPQAVAMKRQRLVELFDRLPPESQARVLAVVRMMRAMREYGPRRRIPSSALRPPEGLESNCQLVVSQGRR